MHDLGFFMLCYWARILLYYSRLYSYYFKVNVTLEAGMLRAVQEVLMSLDCLLRSMLIGYIKILRGILFRFRLFIIGQ